MSNDTSGGKPFGLKVDEATEHYRKVLYGDEYYYGPEIDVVLHEAVRKSYAADGSVSMKSLCEQLDGPHPSDFETTVAEGLRDLIAEKADE